MQHGADEELSLIHIFSIEMAARELRYQWFEKIRKEYQADVVAVAHHQDDSIETILLNLIRGTGITGLLEMCIRDSCIPLNQSSEYALLLLHSAHHK